MSGPSPAKRVPSHDPSGGKRRPKPWTVLIVGGLVFVMAWMVWTFWFQAAIP